VFGRRVEHMKRSIPAYTGQPSGWSGCRRPCRVHPRLHGAAQAPSTPRPGWLGPSPPTRGSPRKKAEEQGGSRSIPAYTGQPQRSRRKLQPRQVHPRLHGAAGRNDAFKERAFRSIPAYTGQPGDGPRYKALGKVHPRLHGAAAGNAVAGAGGLGPSPPTRGSPDTTRAPGAVDGSIPAYTGQPAAPTASIA